MGLAQVESSIANISKSLKEVQSRRETLLKETREVISNSARAIVAAHGGRMQEASEAIREAEGRLADLKKVSTPDLRRYLVPAEAEYVEAQVVFSIASGKSPPSFHKLGVDGGAYLLGLLDAVGEIKRIVYDEIREGRSKDAHRHFKTAEDLYLLLAQTAVYDNVVPGLKRKIDVVRMLIEDTRPAVTEEIRRSAFLKELRRVEASLGRDGDARR